MSQSLSLAGKLEVKSLEEQDGGIELMRAMRWGVYFIALLISVFGSSCATPGSHEDFASAKAEGVLLTEVREITAEEGLLAARLRLLDGLQAADDSHGALERRVIQTTADPNLILPDSLAALPAARRSRVTIAMVPGTRATKAKGKDLTRECLRGSIVATEELGFSFAFIETEARGTVEENATLIAERLEEIFHQSDHVILVMLSKGAHDVIRYLQEDGVNLPASQRKKLTAVLSLAGTVQGSIVADWMAHSSRPMAATTRWWLQTSGQEEAIEMLESISRSPWQPEKVALLSRRFPNLTWVSIAMVPNGEDGRITEKLWAPRIRQAIERTAPYYSPSDGFVESAASILPDTVSLPQWVVTGLGSHAVPNGIYRNGSRIAPNSTNPKREKLRPESGREIMSAYLRALPTSILK